MIGMVELKQLQQRLIELSPAITNILRISGTVGASIGVLHQGDVVETFNFGTKDVRKKCTADKNTLYYIGELSMFMTAAMIGCLVDEDILDWNSRLSDMVDFKHHDKNVRQQATIRHVLNNDMGLAPMQNIYLGEDGCPQIVDREMFLTTIESQSILSSYPVQAIVNPWLFGLAADLIELINRRSFSETLDDEFFKVLGMHRTFIDVDMERVGNVAKAHMTDGNSSTHIHQPLLEGISFYGAAVGVKSSVNDLLLYYKSLLDAAEDQLINRRTSTPHSPFQQVHTLLDPNCPIMHPRNRRGCTRHSMGCAMNVLPSALGWLSGNIDLVRKMPRIGAGMSTSPTIYHHGGSISGYTSAAILVPETKTAIVVLCNTLANGDAADWISQAVLEAVLDVPNPTDFVPLAAEAAASYKQRIPRLRAGLESARTQGTTPRELDCYYGTYDNLCRSLYLNVELDDGTLWLSINNPFGTRHRLNHYHDDSFVFELDLKDFVAMEMRPVFHGGYYVLEFRCGEVEGGVVGLVWKHDERMVVGERFLKRGVGGVAVERFRGGR